MIEITESIRAEEREAILAHWDRAVSEPGFLRALRLHPHVAVEERLGVRVPSHVTTGVDPIDSGLVRMESRAERPEPRSGGSDRSGVDADRGAGRMIPRAPRDRDRGAPSDSSCGAGDRPGERRSARPLPTIVPHESPEITKLLLAHQQGDKGAFDALVPAVYRELRKIARGQLRSRRDGDTLETTALVNEAYLRLVDVDNVEWESRSHFFAIAAVTMRRILVDTIRRRTAQKRGGGVEKVDLEDDRIAIDEQEDSLLALDRALDELAEFNERMAKVVECRFFAGMTEEEIGEALGVSTRTVRREWVRAKAWLMAELDQ